MLGWLGISACVLGQEKAATQLETPPYRGLDASLYMLTSAEYRACCIQAYRWARIVTQEKLTSRRKKELPASVVMDLDETVLDNGWFQSMQIRDKVAFDQKRWEKWEDEGAEHVRLVPNAKLFIDQIRALGVQPVYITNRNERARAQTMAILKRFDIAVPENQLLCADNKTGSNKSSRRVDIESRFEVLLYIGDNLRDFDERFRFDPVTGMEGRAKAVDEHSDKFGIDWIILPNPSYGEWMRATKGNPEDANLLYK